MRPNRQAPDPDAIAARAAWAVAETALGSERWVAYWQREIERETKAILEWAGVESLEGRDCALAGLRFIREKLGLDIVEEETRLTAGTVALALANDTGPDGPRLRKLFEAIEPYEHVGGVNHEAPEPAEGEESPLSTPAEAPETPEGVDDDPAAPTEPSLLERVRAGERPIAELKALSREEFDLLCAAIGERIKLEPAHGDPDFASIRSKWDREW